MTPEEARNLEPGDIVLFVFPDDSDGEECIVEEIFPREDPLVRVTSYSKYVRAEDYLHPEEMRATGRKINFIEKTLIDWYWRIFK